MLRILRHHQSISGLQHIAHKTFNRIHEFLRPRTSDSRRNGGAGEQREAN